MPPLYFNRRGESLQNVFPRLNMAESAFGAVDISELRCLFRGSVALKGGLSAENEQNRDSESREQKEQARRAFKRWESVCDGPIPSFYAQAIEDDWCLWAEL